MDRPLNAEMFRKQKPQKISKKDLSKPKPEPKAKAKNKEE
jgi:hypothetical protein